MRKDLKKRFWLVAVTFLVAGALGACADEPMAVEEPYEVQLDETTGTNCVVIDGQTYCKG